GRRPRAGARGPRVGLLAAPAEGAPVHRARGSRAGPGDREPRALAPRPEARPVSGSQGTRDARRLRGSRRARLDGGARSVRRRRDRRRDALIDRIDLIDVWRRVVAIPAPASLVPVRPGVFELPKDVRPGMRVPVRVYGTEELVAAMDDQVFIQAANVATLPGIVDASLVMPDAHWGYGFPIGGVAAMDPDTGVISPGGIGFDINCGMRLV